MATEIIISVLGGLVSGVVGGWVSGRQAAKREIGAFTASAKRDLTTTTSQGDNSPNVGGGRDSTTQVTAGERSPVVHAGPGANAAGGDLNVHHHEEDKTAHLVFVDDEVRSDMRRLSLRNDGKGPASEVAFAYEFYDSQRGEFFRPVPRVISPGQLVEIGGYGVMDTFGEQPENPWFEVSWLNTDGTPDRNEVRGHV